jgi:hypothetical protein
VLPEEPLSPASVTKNPEKRVSVREPNLIEEAADGIEINFNQDSSFFGDFFGKTEAKNNTKV